MIERHERRPNKNYECSTQREHFNYLRNNSCGIWGTFDWGNEQTEFQGRFQKQRIANPRVNIEDNRRIQENERSKNKKGVSFDNANVSFDKKSPQKGQMMKKNVKEQHNPRNNQNFQRKSKIVKDQQAQKQKKAENRQKVQNYIQQLRPFSRTLTNSKFQQYFNKAAPQCYGRANTNQPIGGIIYGNHLKTFNMNPHSFTNKPEHYQTHTTALNYGKRTKLCPDVKYKNLERQLSKKLGLKDKNQTIKEGKEVVYVDIDDSNMYQVMKQNHEFAKANREQIRAKENQYKKQKQQEHLDDINEFLAKKQAKIADGLNQSTIAASSQRGDEDYEARLNQQVIYKYHDKNGNVRYAGDRHAVTCFVDLNFPENQAIYTEQLKNRMPIFPIKVGDGDKNIDSIRIANCKKGRQEIYPSHYLIRNCEEPEVLKMLANKSGMTSVPGRAGGNSGARKIQNKGVTLKNKSFASTNYTKGNRQQNYGTQNNYGGQLQGNNQMIKSQIMQEAWRNPQVADSRYGNNNNKNYGRSSTCCEVEHLPHNQYNPQCYKNASQLAGKIPYAG